MDNLPQTNNTGFLLRFFASVTDLVISWLVFLGPLLLLMRVYQSQMVADPLMPLVNLVTYILLATFLGSVLVVAYYLYFISKFGGTLGKLAFGLNIVDVDTNSLLDYKTVFYRTYVGYAFSAGFLGLGFFRILTNKNNYAWHDELFGTKVVTKSNPLFGFIALGILLVLVGVVGFQIVDLALLITR